MVYCHLIPFVVLPIFRICRNSQWDHYELQRLKEVFGKCMANALLSNVSITSQCCLMLRLVIQDFWGALSMPVLCLAQSTMNIVKMNSRYFLN